MRGKRAGWLIAAGLALLACAAAEVIYRITSVSPPTGPALDPSNLAALALPISPDDAWPIFTDDADSGTAYRQTIDAWDDLAEQEAEEFVQSPGDHAPAALQYLLDARHGGRMTLFSLDLSSVVNYDSEHPALEKLFSAGELTYKAGLSLVVHQRADEGTAYLEAAFALGRDLYRERVVFDECEKGMQLMDDSAAAMSRTLPRDSPLAVRLIAFQTRMEDYQTQRMQPIWQVISTVDQATIDQTAGDVLAFAQKSAEPMWRVEAVLKLGRYRFDAGSLGDQVGAGRALGGLSSDTNPAVAAAARAGSALDIETYRMIH